MRDLVEVRVLLAQQVFEEGIDVRCSHPSFQPNAVLLDLLSRLAFCDIWCFHTKVECKLTPGLDLFGIELLDKFEQAKGFKVFVVALWRALEVGSQG